MQMHVEEIAALIRQGSYTIEAGLIEMYHRAKAMLEGNAPDAVATVEATPEAAPEVLPEAIPAAPEAAPVEKAED